MRRLIAVAVVVLGLGSMHGCSCNDEGGAGDGGLDMSVDDLTAGGDDLTGTPPADLTGLDLTMVIPSTDGGCTPLTMACTTSAQCCSGVCGSNNTCVPGMCQPDGATCTKATDCCKLNCAPNGTCSPAMCIADNAACTAGGAPCCSTKCVNGSCMPLNTCKTAGNPCPNGNSDCCSKICTGGFCASPSQISYCTQAGDICFHDAECCTAVCVGATATTAGTCAQLTLTCSVDGTTCSGCSTTPRCCSGFCAPFGNTGNTICQPASGCHVLGDLCTKTKDCCGGDPSSNLPGAGLVICQPDPTYPQIGTCSQANPNNCPMTTPVCKNTCQPEGDVCHYQGVGGCSSNTYPANCCGLPGASSGVCKLDSLGVPRCYGLGSACVMPGGSCASSADCCNNLPCVPDSTGALKCGSMCVQQNGACTTTADCCTGLQCIVTPGQLKGTCTVPLPPPTDGGAPPDLAGVDLFGADLSQPPPDLSQPPPPMCALYGQACSTTTPCCGGQGSCLTPYPASAACPAGATNCTCYVPLL